MLRPATPGPITRPEAPSRTSAISTAIPTTIPTEPARLNRSPRVHQADGTRCSACRRNHWRGPWPASLLSMTVGALAWGQTWQAAARVWPLPGWMPEAARWLSLAFWLLVLTAYLRSCLVHRAAARDEWAHPVQSALLSLGPVSLMLAAGSLQPVWHDGAFVLFSFGLGLQLGLGLWLVGRFWQGGREPASVTATAYLPAVAQNLVAATTAATFGWTTLAQLLFGAGVFSWLALESLVLSRAATHDELHASHRPLQGIQMAPPVVGGLAYLSITPGAGDLLAHMLFGYGLFQALIALRLMHWSTRAGLVSSYWAFSFGVMALSSMGLTLLQRAPQQALWAGLAPVLFAAANLTLLSLAGITVQLVRQGRLLPHPESPPASCPGRVARPLFHPTPHPSPNPKPNLTPWRSS